jgi:Regulator of chromosome condensation (RCC1) repeat
VTQTVHAAKRGKEKPVEEVPEPKKCVNIADCSKVSCGAEFTMWLCKGKLYAAGNPQNGQLGDGTDHSLNVKDSSIKIMHEPQGVPSVVPHIPDEVTNVACGVNHTVCVTNEGECFTWGSGNYGRLGHKVQQVQPVFCMSTSLAIHAIHEQGGSVAEAISNFAAQLAVSGAPSLVGRLQESVLSALSAHVVQ